MATTKSFPVKGMHCASCAVIIEKTLKKTPGVMSAEVNYGTESAQVVFDDTQTSPQALSKKIQPLGYGLQIEEHQHSEKQSDLHNLKKQLQIAIPIAIFSLLMMAWDTASAFKLLPEMDRTLEEFIHHLFPILASYILFVVGKPYLLGLGRFIRSGKANMDTLIGLGTSAAFLYSFAVSAFEQSLAPYLNVSQNYYDVTIVVIVFIALGKYLEHRSKLKTGDAIQKLLNLQAKTAFVLRANKEIEIPIDQVLHGDHIIVKPGEKIPVDGIITEGSSYIDESMISGEAMPVNRKINEAVIAGTINTSGSFVFKATKIGSETMLAHIIKMVEEAQSSKAPIQALADKISGVFVPIVLVLSFVALAAWLFFGIPVFGFSQALSYGLVSFVGILVIACPCALGLATPTAIIVGVGKGAAEGILIKDAATLQKLQSVDTIVMDKTGTITQGQPKLISLENYSDISDDQVVLILASLEKKSEHPLAKAVLDYATTKNIKADEVHNFEALKGLGLKGTVKNQEYILGNETLMRQHGIKYDAERISKHSAQGKTPIILADAQGVLAIAFIADALKTETPEAIKNLHRLGIRVILLTGDTEKTARHIAAEAGIDEVVANVLPKDKLDKIKELQSAGKIVAMAGDGINDAPALAQADVGIAMATGTDVAIESAGITLLHGDISKIVKAIRLSKITMRGIKQNLFWAFIYNVIGIPLAGGLFFPFFGWLLNPIFAGLAMGLSSVSVVSNSLRLKTKKL